MSLTHALLGVLDARPMNGYELTKFFDSGTRWVWSAPQSQIYTTLPKMQAAGLIEGTTQDRGTRMKSQVYGITDKGRQELTQWAATTHATPPHRDAFFLQALFLDLVDDDAAIGVLEKFIADNEEMIRQWSSHRELLLAGATPLLRERLNARPAAEHARIIAIKAQAFQGEIDRATAMVRWARDTLKILAGE